MSCSVGFHWACKALWNSRKGPQHFVRFTAFRASEYSVDFSNLRRVVFSGRRRGCASRIRTTNLLSMSVGMDKLGLVRRV